MELTKVENVQALMLSNVPATVELLLTSPAVYCYKAGLKTELDVIKSQSDSLVTLEKRQKGASVAYLTTLVENLASAFNIGKNMDGVQVIETALGILEDFPQFTVNDIALCFNKTKKGAYGKVFDRMDSATIFEFLDQYHEAKLEALEKYNRELLKAEKTQPESPENAEAFKAAANKWLPQIKKHLNTDIVVREVAKTHTDPLEAKYQQWLKQFDQLAARGKTQGGIKFIRRYGKWLDYEGFLKYKLWQYEQAQQRFFS